jgi:hypothetical protein
VQGIGLLLVVSSAALVEEEGSEITKLTPYEGSVVMVIHNTGEEDN